MHHRRAALWENRTELNIDKTIYFAVIIAKYIVFMEKSGYTICKWRRSND